MLYLKLFHGRNDPAKDMDDWGFDGPVFGPYQFIHTTYANFIKMGRTDGKMDELRISGPDMVYYGGSYYGDWSVYEMLEEEPMLQAFDAAKANPPKLPRRQAKIIVSIKGGVCLDVKSNIPEGCWEYAIVDYDNDPDLPDDYVPFSEDEMKPFL